MGQHHHHIAANRVITREALREEFGFSEAAGKLTRDLLGETHQALLAELAAIAEHQWRSENRRGLVKGFLLFGPPGTGKTSLARRLTLELCERFREGAAAQPVVMAMIDGAEIARSRYGESEERILDIFAHAKAGFSEQNQRSVVLFDDIESVFMSRDNQNAKEWHFSQDSVFFHAVDNLDTTRSILVLTSNRPDLVDAAIRDRFLTYEIGYPDLATLHEIVRGVGRAQNLEESQIAALEIELTAAHSKGEIRSIRDAQRFAVRFYVQNILGRQSRAQLFSG